MSSVVWYYSVKGKISSPLSWEELCDAVKEQKFGPDDLVWTKSFGKEWRKASTLEDLFGGSVQLETPIVEEPEQTPTTNPESEQVLEPEPANIEDMSSDEPQQEAPVVKQRVSVRLGLRRAYYGMLGILFPTPFNIMRWIPLAVALFLASQMSSNFVLNATESLFSKDGKILQKLRENSAELGIAEEFYTSGVFSNDWKNEFMKLNTFLQETQNQRISQQEMSNRLIAIYSELTKGIGTTATYLWKWLKSFSGAIVVGTMFVTAFLMKICLFWFGARGRFIAMARCYYPLEPFGVSWRRVASASNRFFRMLVVFELVTSLIYLILSLALIRYVANSFVAGELTYIDIGYQMMAMIVIYSLLMFVNYYLRNFVSLPILLENKRLTLRYIFKGFGGWILRYGIVYQLLIFLIQTLLSFVGSFVGVTLITMIFSMPLTGQLLALPVLAVHLLWTMDITIQMRPELARIAPPEDPWQLNK
ncbi:MAG: DUF4339 domain-containing protein [Kiritimatiellae bacterium]|nr:DUF4339 domain-containing protein [Kiritimatiellia bacterium]